MLIGELARRCGVSTRSLRYYEEQALLQSSRDSNSYRHYEDAAVLTVHQIRGLLDAGFGTDAIRALLPCANGTEPRIEMCPQVAAEMHRTLSRIEHDLAALQQRRLSVSTMLQS
ncbi:MAG: MerR family transcriptional regulator [Rhodococcus sp. (in: high G+C Gram-positive bacteria)]|uniref:MerR family transcriptional regulator n=1 Tax=Rhodococcus sp. TaxID=1831 RepID=UPI002ADAE636|nr:MerR family transcriptional regulator [Rhodococcus sp. (in: high G+C Gram-positive bacteria)]MDZ7928986.1 MerR family transcriptional regulator [Rhodococcus sp. (in: high G+C Gram-positive bacteria)]